MDKEEINVASSDNSYDPDAAELLKDLDDDDDEEESFGAGIDTNLEPRNSLVNILTSSANLESLTTFPSMPPVVAELPAGEPIGKQASAADFAASQIKDEEPKDSGESKESKDSGDSEVPNDTLQDMRPAAEVKPPERAATVKLGRPFDADMPKTALEPIKSSDERLNVPDHVSEDNASLKQNDRASHPNNKRPPVPPRASMPSIAAAVPANMRLLKEGESVYTQDAIKEFCEATLTTAYIENREIPTPDEMGVVYSTYLRGLAETPGELRRRTMDILRMGYSDEAERLLSQMDEIYSILVTMDYPDAVTNGLRRQTDLLRGIVERTRADLTLSLREDKLKELLSKAIETFTQNEK